MRNWFRLAACLLALSLLNLASAQNAETQIDEVSPETTSTAVAHVYVGSGNQTLAFSAAANGKLTAVPGSPFKYSLSLMGANGRYLFGLEPSSIMIDSLSMASNGAIKKVSTTNPEDYWPKTDCPLVAWNGQGLRVDHSGVNLYNAAIPEDVFCQMNFQSYQIDEANGVLTYLGETDPVFDGGTELDILGNNKFAYAPECFDFDAPGPINQDNNYHTGITIYQRLSSGELANTTATGGFPTAPNDNSDPTQPSPGFYCPLTAATDPTNHMAMLMGAIDQNLAVRYGPLVIATYTADANGNLTTTSTYKNMPEAETGGGWMRMSPSGKLLAVGGAGLEIFHFNGGNPITKYKMLLAGNSISQILWDNNNHMYALGSNAKGAGQLWVYTVTPTSVTEAPGSPYSIASPGNMVVHPLS